MRVSPMFCVRFYPLRMVILICAQRTPYVYGHRYGYRPKSPAAARALNYRFYHNDLNCRQPMTHPRVHQPPLPTTLSQIKSWVKNRKRGVGGW